MEGNNSNFGNKDNNDNSKNNENIKIIPNNIQANDNSPKEQEFVIINKDGNVDYFVRCGNWNINDKNGNKYLYQRISFEVDKKIYDKNYNGIEEFKNEIRNTKIKQIDVAIYNPKRSLYANWDKKEVFTKDKIKVNNNITCGEIFDAFKNATYKTLSKNMSNFLASVGAHRETFECQQSEFGENLDSIRKTGHCHIEDLEKSEQDEYLRLQNENGLLKEKLNPSQKDLIDLKNEIFLLDKNVRELKKKNKEYKADQDIFNADNNQLKKDQEKFEQEKEKFEQEKVLLEKKQVELQKKQVEFENEKGLLEKGQNELENENNKLKGLLDKLQNENNQLKINNNQLKIDNGLLKDEKNKLKGEKDKLKGEKDKLEDEKEENKTKVSELFQQDYVIRKEGLFGCCCGPAYSSLEEAIAAAQAEKEPAIVN